MRLCQWAKSLDWLAEEASVSCLWNTCHNERESGGTCGKEGGRERERGRGTQMNGRRNRKREGDRGEGRRERVDERVRGWREGREKAGGRNTIVSVLNSVWSHSQGPAWVGHVQSLAEWSGGWGVPCSWGRPALSHWPDEGGCWLGDLCEVVQTQQTYTNTLEQSMYVAFRKSYVHLGVQCNLCRYMHRVKLPSILWSS